MTSCCIERLSDDVLRELFDTVADIDPPRTSFHDDDDSDTEDGSLGWIRMTHVCRRWRRIGLDMSVLWARIICMFPAGVKTIAQRTKATPLTLHFRDDGAPDKVWVEIKRYS